MRLLDTSVWIDFWRGDQHALELAQLLEDREVLLHPWVLGELALGGLGPRRHAVLHDLMLLNPAPVASDQEALSWIDRHELAGTGLGWVDVQLLASARIASAEIWTSDQRLASAWRRYR